MTIHGTRLRVTVRSDCLDLAVEVGSTLTVGVRGKEVIVTHADPVTVPLEDQGPRIDGEPDRKGAARHASRRRHAHHGLGAAPLRDQPLTRRLRSYSRPGRSMVLIAGSGEQAVGRSLVAAGLSHHECVAGQPQRIEDVWPQQDGRGAILDSCCEIRLARRRAAGLVLIGLVRGRVWLPLGSRPASVGPMSTPGMSCGIRAGG